MEPFNCLFEIDGVNITADVLLFKQEKSAKKCGDKLFSVFVGRKLFTNFAENPAV